MRKVTLSDGQEVTIRFTGRTAFKVEDSVLDLRGKMVAGGISDLNLDVTQLTQDQLETMTPLARDTTMIYLLAGIKSLDDAPVTEDALLDLDITDFNLLVAEAQAEYQESRSPLVRGQITA